MNRGLVVLVLGAGAAFPAREGPVEAEVQAHPGPVARLQLALRRGGGGS